MKEKRENVLLRLVRTYLRPYRSWLAIVGVAQIFQTIATLYLPTLNADIIDNGVIKGNTGYIFGTGGVMLAVAVGQVAATLIVVYFAARTAMAVGRDIRRSLFGKVQEFSAREVGKFGTPSLITRTTNDVQQVQMLVLTLLTMMLSTPIIGVGAFLLAFRQDVPLSSLLLIMIPVLGIVMTLLVRRMQPLSRLMQVRIDTINKVLREQITGIRVIRAFVRDRPERERFRGANEDVYEVALGAGRLMLMMLPAVLSVANVSSVAVLWFGGHLINGGTMQVGALTAFLSYLIQALTAVIVATSMLVLVPRADVCAERIQEVLGTSPSVRPPAEPLPAQLRKGFLDLSHVGFRYPGAEEPVLSDITLRARPGEVTAIIGSTGSGKTTLLNLIPRLFDATEGQVQVGGVDVKDLDPDALTKAVAIVPQRPYLFSGTIASNLRYGRPDATDEELREALEIAQATGFVTDLDAPISQGGTNVSGGQRQRLAIARTLVRKPDIYLFDDSFSALDYATDAALRAALERHTEHVTVLIVAQRVSTIRHADRIVVLDRGTIAGMGTHEELMESSETYREIVFSQLTEQEAA